MIGLVIALVILALSGILTAWLAPRSKRKKLLRTSGVCLTCAAVIGLAVLAFQHWTADGEVGKQNTVSASEIDWESLRWDWSRDIKPTLTRPENHQVSNKLLLDLYHELDLLWRTGKRGKGQDLAQMILNIAPQDPVATVAMEAIEQANRTMRARSNLTYIPQDYLPQLMDTLGGTRYRIIQIQESEESGDWSDRVTLQQLTPGWLFFSEVTVYRSQIEGLGSGVGDKFTIQSSSTPTPSASATPRPELLAERGYIPRFEPAECQFDIPDGWLGYYDLECGFLIVPEDRADPQGTSVKLHVAIFHSNSPSPEPDPVIYLTGGGGANQLVAEGMQQYLDAGVNELLNARDFIFYNQRGAQLNQPTLDCPGYHSHMAYLAEKSFSKEEQNQAEIEFLLDCQSELLAQGINLEMYNSATNAADANDLRIALGYETANYYGTSYGTRLGLALIRDYPEGVRSIILDSVYPPEVNFYGEFAHNAQRAFDIILDDCATSPSCRKSYPNLKERFYQLVDELDQNPLYHTMGENQTWIDGRDLMDAIYLSFYVPDFIPKLPYAIYQASLGNHNPLDWAYQYPLQGPSIIAQGVFWSLQCREEVPFESPAELEQLTADLHPQIQRWYTNPTELAGCELWESGVADPVANQPVTSDVPALIFAGRYDPITPPAWSAGVAKNLSNSYYYEFPNLGHGVMRADKCAFDIGLQFLDDPNHQPDDGCAYLLSIPAFY